MSEYMNSSYIDPETGVETKKNPQAVELEYTDPTGRRQRGYSIGNRMYKDESGTQRIENGSIVTNASGTQTWVMTEKGGVKLQEYVSGQGGGQSASGLSGTNYLSEAKSSALNAAGKRTEAEILALEGQRPEIERAYRDIGRQNYQGYMQSREGLANSLASQGLYNSGYSDSAQVRQRTGYLERSNATALERVRTLRELETQISLARMEGSANLSELEAQYQQLMQEQWNADRAYNYQVGRDAIGDLQREREFEAAQAAVEFEKELALKEAKSAEEQQAIENAFKLGMAGDVSQLKELGMETSYLERLLELEEQQLYQSVYGKGGGSSGVYGGGDTQKGNSEKAPSYQYTYDELYEQFSDMLYYEVVSATSTEDLDGNKTTTTKKDQERRSEAETNVVNTLLSLELSGQVSSGDAQALLDSFGLRSLYNETLNAERAKAEKEEKEEEAKARKQASRKERIDKLYEELHHADAAKTEEVEKYALSLAENLKDWTGEQVRQYAEKQQNNIMERYGAEYVPLYMKLIEYHHPEM